MFETVLYKLIDLLVSELGAVQSKVDPCVIYFPEHDDQPRVEGDTSPWSGSSGIHVDDLKGAASAPQRASTVAGAVEKAVEGGEDASL